LLNTYLPGSLGPDNAGAFIAGLKALIMLSLRTQQTYAPWSQLFALEDKELGAQFTGNS